MSRLASVFLAGATAWLFLECARPASSEPPEPSPAAATRAVQQGTCHCFVGQLEKKRETGRFSFGFGSSPSDTFFPTLIVFASASNLFVRVDSSMSHGYTRGDSGTLTRDEFDATTRWIAGSAECRQAADGRPQYVLTAEAAEDKLEFRRSPGDLRIVVGKVGDVRAVADSTPQFTVAGKWRMAGGGNPETLGMGGLIRDIGAVASALATSVPAPEELVGKPFLGKAICAKPGPDAPSEMFVGVQFRTPQMVRLLRVDVALTSSGSRRRKDLGEERFITECSLRVGELPQGRRSLVIGASRAIDSRITLSAVPTKAFQCLMAEFTIKGTPYVGLLARCDDRTAEYRFRGDPMKLLDWVYGTLEGDVNLLFAKAIDQERM